MKDIDRRLIRNEAVPWNKLYDKSRFKVSDSSDQETEETYKQPDFENFEEGENTEQ